MDGMSNTGDHGSWVPQGHDPHAQDSGQDHWSPPPQDPWAQPSAGSASDPYGPSTGAGPALQGQPQSRLVVGLLGIFLGAFGVHRFLMGYTTIGIVQIAVTLVSCGLGGWWGVIEGIMVLAKSPTFERDAYGRPLTD